MVRLYKVGICGATILDPLVAIIDRGEGYRAIRVQSKLPMTPVKDNGDTIWI